MNEWNESGIPTAYLITFRTFASWLHGDERGSVDTHGKNIYGTPDIAPNADLAARMRRNIVQDVVLLDARQRETIETAIKDLCEQREYVLHAVNARSNHVHVVVTAQTKPERLADALKAAATKKLRERFLMQSAAKIWSRGRSRIYLWNEREVALAVEYVLYSQGDVPFPQSETRTK